ncbi:MAG: START domain-containing protein [Bacteroidota bacterium]
MKTIGAFLLLLLVSTTGFAGGQWVLKRDEDGIKVYTAIQENSPFRLVKVECTMSARPSQLVAYLLDISKQTEWVYNTATARLLKQAAPNDVTFYAEVSVPWPCTNRDYVAHFTVAQPSPKLITIESHTEPDLLPEQKGKIRVRKSSAHWDIISLSAEELRVVYVVAFDPAGSVPAWLTNLFVAKGPYETFQKLRTGLNKPEYRSARLPFIKE